MPRKIVSGTVDKESTSEVKDNEVKPKASRRSTTKKTTKQETKEAVKVVDEVNEVNEVNKKNQESENESDGWDDSVGQPVTVVSPVSTVSTTVPVAQIKFSERENTQPKYQRQSRTHQPHQTQRPKSAALSFAYKDYSSFRTPAVEASTPDLLRVLIVRAHEDGQVHLKRCLENTLRAVNLECKFPTLPPLRTGGPKHHHNHQPQNCDE